MPYGFLNTIKQLASDTFKSAQTHDVALHGAAIAFYTIFSTAPLIIITFALINFFLGEQQTTRVISDYITQLAGEDIAATLLNISENSRRQASGFFASIAATAVLLFGATTVIAQLKDTLNTIWGITEPKINSVAQYVVNRLVSLLIILVLTLIFLATLLVEGGLTFFSDFVATYLSASLLPVVRLVSVLLSISMTVIFFTIIFNVLPDVSASWRDVFIGACVTSVLFLAGKYLIGLYLSSASMHASYKAAGSFTIFMIWIYYNVQIVLLGAEFTQVYTKRFGRKIRPAWNAEIISGEEN